MSSFTCKWESCPDYGFTFRHPGIVLEPGRPPRAMTPAEDAAHHHATVHANLARRAVCRKPLVDAPAA